MDKDAELEARLPTEETFSPPEEFVEQANVTDDPRSRFREEWPEVWTEAADLLQWEEPWEEVVQTEEAPTYDWFAGGTLNACVNCVDRHLEDRADAAAIEWIGEPGERRTLSYADLHAEVQAFAAALRALGVTEDDVVTLYMPMIPELPVAMLACARLGAPHSVVFAGFSAEALATRMERAGSEYLVTADAYYRRGELLDHRSKAEAGVTQADHDISEVVVVERESEGGPGVGANQRRYRDLVGAHNDARVQPVARDSSDMLFLMYTSGTTGAPKGVEHGTGGYLSHVTWTSQAVLDLEPGDTYWCSADIGWITGHSYIVYGPLALGCTTVMYEGAPDHPDRDRIFAEIDAYDVDVFYTAPTAIRAFMKWGTEHPDAHDLSSLRLLGTVGEPINPRAWKWYYTQVGNESCPVVDTWWQTETGGMMISTLPGIDEMKPGSAGEPLPGISADIVDARGDPVGAENAGNLVINRPWPGMLRTLYGDDDRFVDEYWREFSRPERDEWVYFPEDGAAIDGDGYITVLGRVDDVLNVSGHRLGTMEIESAIVDVSGVAEAAVVGGDHEVTGEAVYAYVTLESGVEADESMRERIVAGVEEAIGPIARPEAVVFTPELPKTRSGKIMRRLLEDIADGEEVGDTTTLRNPEVVEQIRQQVQGE
jgi:acetyl-CoA synthetase